LQLYVYALYRRIFVVDKSFVSLVTVSFIGSNSWAFRHSGFRYKLLKLFGVGNVNINCISSLDKIFLCINGDVSFVSVMVFFLFLTYAA